VGGMGIQAIRQVVGVLDAPETTTLDALGTAVDALSPPESAPETAIDATEQAEWWRAEVDIDAFLRTRGWCVRPEAASRRGLIDGLVALRRVHGPDVPALAFATYADLIHGLATQEIDSVRAELQGNTSTAIEAVVIGTVMWEPVLLALRRLAHEALSRELLASF
ncbi:MAG: hypothetical protein H7338_01340, partial [Candidatus Sericytochromatia bacterium]|nr:hypothetical protein [Candidatus Sericytochromatia bacterium]